MPGLLDFFSDPDAQEQMRQRALALAQQGARGVTTGLLGAPVDIANMAMAGVGGEAPVMGSQWIGDKLSRMGLLAPPPKDIGESGAEFLGGLVNPPSGLLGGAGKALIAFHGSPHLFDKFDMSKIGTGEGAQAYGHGLYFAERPGVAQSYADKLGKDSYNIFTPEKGNLLDYDIHGSLAAAQVGSPTGKITKDNLISTIKDRYQYGEVDPAVPLQTYLDRVNSLVRDGKIDFNRTGNLYKVDIPDEAVAKMLDWDKPLSQQPASVRKALAPLLPQPRPMPELRAAYNNIQRQMDDLHTMSDQYRAFDAQLGQIEREMSRSVQPETGADIYKLFGNHGIDSDMGDEFTANVAAAKLLRDAGIPGIRYLDAGSRSGGAGTSNFVLFDDSLAKILSRE